ncbi:MULTISPECIES: ChaN family lipoprotein [Sphingobacterium]|uniref:ChaN family lipoprotein n=1 Tax=Sphingobacterium tenebrionis TaxID=3111775 RepID=A0ABU8I630_9SPHI|nr:ChaN family lipoprotein [Sphingobacterium sp. CZ-2]QBR11258.1 iron-regulated protein [Sphingobacterium sp. CZ-2]
MKIIGILILFLLPNMVVLAQEVETQEFVEAEIILKDKNGKNSSLENVVQAVEERPLVFFGELHDNEQAHKVQLKLLTLLNKVHPTVVLGMEMFETDVQHIIDEYFADLISQKSFESEARVWSNYQNDYKPLVEFAKANKIKLIASNVPRRYANAVYKQGITVLDKFDSRVRSFMAKLPLKVDTTLTTYQDMREMLPGHDATNMIFSQALKDATMAEFILKNYQEGQVFLHINGAYHSKMKEGIISFFPKDIQQKVLTINTVKREEVTPELLATADFTLIVD